MTNIEILGYFSTIIVIISFLMKNMFHLRIINSVACALFIIYGNFITSIPVIITNVFVLLANLYYLNTLRKGK